MSLKPLRMMSRRARELLRMIGGGAVGGVAAVLTAGAPYTHVPGEPMESSGVRWLAYVVAAVIGACIGGVLYWLYGRDGES